MISYPLIHTANNNKLFLKIYYIIIIKKKNSCTKNCFRKFVAALYHCSGF